MARSPMRGHHSVMPADEYYDRIAGKEEELQKEGSLSLKSVPFFDRPMDADESDRQVGGFEENENPVFKTLLGNTYTVSRNPDQRTTRTKVTDAADAFLENPRLPTKDEVVGVGKAALEGAVDVVSTPKRLLTGEQSPTETQMGDVFDVSVGTGIIGATQKLPENALGMFMGRYAKNLPEGDIKDAFQADMIGQDTGTLNELGELVPTDFGNPEDQDLGMLIGMVQNGADLPKTKQAILDAGWSEGKDGKYRWELSDKDAKVDESKFTVLSAADIDSAINAPLANVNYSELGDVLDHPNLYKNYPDLKTMPVFVDTDLTGTTTAGYFNTQEGYLAVAQDQLNNPKELKRTLLHEVMHKIQQKEDFDSGTNVLSDEVRKIYDSRANAPEAKAAWAKYDQDIANYDFNHIPKSLDLFRNIIKFSEDNNLNYGKHPFIEDVKVNLRDSIRAAKMARDARRDLGPNSSEYKKLLQFAIDRSTSNTLTVMRRFSTLMEAAERGEMGPRSKSITQDYRDTFKDLPILEDGSLMFNSQNIGTQLLGLEQPLLPDYINPNATPTQISADKRTIYRSKSGEVEATNVEYRMDLDDAQRSENSPKETEFGATGFERDEQFTTEQARALPNTYAQGGLTSMNDQTQMAFALGGEAETVDPVSGNDVPPGSLPEEVRDDIDAKLSEGEYVVPADVVRFFGVKLFEDLRMQAKIGLQQMDADGRIGGEPVQEQPQVLNDSMDVAELKAALSKSGMYAGGLAKGDTIDSFIDDASRDPMVNGRMRANGATVKMAVGGLVPTGTYGDVNKVDGLIKQLMTAANKDPNLMKRLASKGITLNKTGADQDANEMKKTNRPKTPIKASAGTYINYSNNYEDYNTLGAKMFMDANIGDPKALINATLLSEKGEITQITLITPDGTEIPVAWNTSMPIPPGFSVKGEEPKVNDPDKPKGLAERDDGAEQRAQDAIQDNAIQAERFNYSIATPEELYDKLRSANTARNLAVLSSAVVGPFGMVISAAASANNAIVTRRVEKELESRIENGDIDPKTGLKNAKGKVETIGDLIAITDTEKATASKGFLADIIGQPLDAFFDGIVEKAIISDAKYFSTDITPTTPTPASGTTKTPKKFNRDDNKKPPAGGSLVTSPVSDIKYGDGDGDGGYGDSITGSGRTQSEIEAGAGGGGYNSSPTGSVSTSSPTASSTVTGRSDDLATGDPGMSRSGGYDKSGASDYDDDLTGVYTGGLIAKPVNKKQNKKRKTQRRKGLGTRP